MTQFEPSVPWREYVDMRFANLESHLDTKFDDMEKYTDAKFGSAALAISKAELAVNQRLEHMNEFREQIRTERGDYVTRKELLGLISIILTLYSTVTVAVLKVLIT